MKSYDETIASVFAKGDAILESRRIRALRIKKISFAVSGLCAAAVVGFSVLHNDAARKAVPKDGDSGSIIIGTDTVVTTVSSQVGSELIVTSVTNTAGTAVTAEKGSKDNNRTTSVRTANDSAGTTAKVNAVTNGKTASAHNGGSSVVTTETGTSANVSDDERSIDMKKITAITTAFLASFSALPITANANDNYRFYSFDKTDDKQIIAYMSNGQIDIDYDGNGKFDINDVYQFYLYADGYVVDDSVKNKVESNGDFDGSGSIEPFSDAIVLMKYYIISNPLDTTIFNVDNYEPAETTPELLAELNMYYDPNEPHYSSAMYFAYNLEFQMRYLGTGYGFMKEMVDSGDISLDVNGDGVFDVADCVDYKIFVDNLIFYDRELFDRYNDTLIEGSINWNKDGIFYGGVTTQPYDEENPCPVDVIKLPEETILRCADVLSKIGCYGGMDSGRYMAYCYLLDNPLDKSYFDETYFEKYYKGASGYNINSSFVFAARTMENIEYCSNFDKEKFKNDFKQYCKDVKEGKKSEPDMNLDGVVDRLDYDDAIVYLNYTFFPIVNKSEDGSEEDLPFSKEEWKNFEKNCDLNGDGKSGDFYDIIMLQCYTLLNDDDTFNSSASQAFYISKEFQSNFALLDSLDIERSGDANLDGNTDISDAVMVMQANANPAKYNMKDKGKFNADVNETGDGVTVKDAQSIQRKLLALE